jgi:hypothetical protein
VTFCANAGAAISAETPMAKAMRETQRMINPWFM